MWIKSMNVYRLTQPVEAFQNTAVMGLGFTGFKALNQDLHAKAVAEPDNKTLARYGFSQVYAPREETLADREDPSLLDDLEPEIPEYVRVVNNGEFLLFKAALIERNLPGAALRRALTQKVKGIEQAEGRKVYKKERDQLKDDLISQMLPHAFILEKVTWALVDVQEGLIYVEGTSSKRAEDFLSTLREALGSLPVRPVSTKLRPEVTMTEWLKKQKATNDYHILDAAILEGSDGEGNKVGMIHQDMTAEEVQLHLQTGKVVTKLALGYQDKLGFVVDGKLTFSKIFFADLLQGQAAEDGGDDLHGQLDAQVVLMGLTFREAVGQLLEGFGGEERPVGL